MGPAGAGRPEGPGRVGFLSDLWSAGLPVPYPVQRDGTERLMEFITVADGSGAPRLAQTRPSGDRLASYGEQLTEALRLLTSMRLACSVRMPRHFRRLGFARAV
jgi:hypothetical protein